MIKLAILASGNGSNAQAIFEAANNGVLNAEIKVVITNKPNAGVISRAKNAGIQVVIIPSKGYKDRSEYDSLILNALSEHNIDTIALAGWMRILSPLFIDSFSGVIVNLHPAILPSFTGANGINDAIEYGVKITGCTVHIVNQELDSGPVIIQAAVPVCESNGSTSELIHRMEHLIFPQALQWLSENRLTVKGRNVRVAPALYPVRYVGYIDGCLISPPLEEKK